jgi:cold shock CspA family protein
MSRIRGRVTHWNRRKAYGFITPIDESKEVFVHISEFNDRREMPALEQWVEFSIATDKQGRPCATEVVMLGESELQGSGRNAKSTRIMVILALVAAAAAGAWYFLR